MNTKWRRENSNIQALYHAIIEQAVKDYRRALAGERLGRNTPSDTIAECEQFFRSTYFTMLTKVKGEYIIQQIRKEFGNKC